VFWRLVFGALLTAGANHVSAQVTDSTVVIEAGDIRVTKAEFEALTKENPLYVEASRAPGGRLAIANEVGHSLAIQAEAQRRKVDRAAEGGFQRGQDAQQKLAYELLLLLRDDYLKNEAALNAQYEKTRDLYSLPQMRQVLVRVGGNGAAEGRGLSIDEARAKAEAIRAKLAAGADFAAMARFKSDDLASRENGGQIGLVRRGSTFAAVEAAAYSLPVGAVSDVIQTERGFYIIRVDGRVPPPLIEVKPIIANELAHRDMNAIAQSYRLNEAYFGR
jgi:hypothetical protein